MDYTWAEFPQTFNSVSPIFTAPTSSAISSPGSAGALKIRDHYSLRIKVSQSPSLLLCYDTIMFFPFLQLLPYHSLPQLSPRRRSSSRITLLILHYCKLREFPNPDQLINSTPPLCKRGK